MMDKPRSCVDEDETGNVFSKEDADRLNRQRALARAEDILFYDFQPSRGVLPLKIFVNTKLSNKMLQLRDDHYPVVFDQDLTFFVEWTFFPDWFLPLIYSPLDDAIATVFNQCVDSVQ